MSSAPVEEQLAEISKLILANCHGRGLSIVTTGESASRLLMLWLNFLRINDASGTADCLIDGVASAVRETIACLVLGLVRPALYSMRLQIDLSLTWLYFKDHPVEWRRVQETGEGFKLKTELLKYLAESHARYGN